ncbi:MAG: hypothetical protein JRC87_07210 [Deltaproteobacteria bacterium]|nr:hypothetical protein [Deltaproteobacteria bacterium]MBW2659364.1 hypothetical protein [Deltaproteobacteria bacterium]
MKQDNELQRLEEFVENLLKNFTELRAEKKRLLQDVRERDEIIEGLRDNVSFKDSEQEEISQRVNKMVDQIEEWELGLDDSEFEESSLTVESGGLEGEQSDGEDMTEGDADSGEDEDGKGQQNLFSVETS